MNDKISFIIIGRNESINIDKCIESITSLKYHNYEIIYIDSNSTDNTDEVLKKYKYVKSYKIKSNMYTAALARDCGVEKSNGEYIFFLDGDMEINNNADIYFCIDLLRKSNLGIVSGELENVWIEEGKIIKRVIDTFKVKDEIQQLICPGGYFITTREAYIKVKRFNKMLTCNEEVDLFSRYKRVGLTAVRTNRLCCLHKNYNENRGKGHINRFKRGYYADFWKVIFNAIKNGYIKEYFSFPSQLTMIRSIILTFLMILFVCCSLINWIFILIPIIYYSLILIKNKFNTIVLKYNQLNNIMILLSLVFIFKKKNMDYVVERI